MAERFSASVASRHMKCSASADLEAAIPHWVAPEEDPSADNAANRGTALHERFAEVMALTRNDAENFSAAVSYVTEVKKLRRFKQLIEVGEKVTWLAHSTPMTTADLVLYVQDEMHVIDLKTGRIPVEVVGNEQLMYYALTYGHYAPKAKGVHLHIVQPWADNMESWYVTTQELMQFRDDALKAEALIHLGSSTFSPGDHCLFCAANPRGRGAKGHPYCPAVMDLYYPQVLDEEAVLDLEEL